MNDSTLPLYIPRKEEPSISKKVLKKRYHTESFKASKQFLLRALASTASSVVAQRAGGADGRAALADVVADVVVAGADLTVNCGLILGPADAFEIGGLGLLASDGVDVAALGDGDLAVVAGALAADLDFGAGELLLYVLVHAGLLGGVGERSLLGVEVALSLLGDDHGVLTLVLSSHCDVCVCVCVCVGLVVG